MTEAAPLFLCGLCGPRDALFSLRRTPDDTYDICLCVGDADGAVTATFPGLALSDSLSDSGRPSTEATAWALLCGVEDGGFAAEREAGGAHSLVGLLTWHTHGSARIPVRLPPRGDTPVEVRALSDAGNASFRGDVALHLLRARRDDAAAKLAAESDALPAPGGGAKRGRVTAGAERVAGKGTKIGAALAPAGE